MTILYVVATINCLRALHDPNDSVKWFQFVGIGLLGGIIVVVRPGNVTTLGLLAVLISSIFLYTSGKFTIRAALLVLIGLGVSFAPQIFYNFIHFHSLSPLPVLSLTTFQLVEGWKYIKFTAVFEPGVCHMVYYPNPVYGSGVADAVPSHTLPVIINHLKYPLRFIFSTCAHLFGLLDQDVALPYNKTLFPWYKWITSPISQIVSSVGILGMIYCYIVNKAGNGDSGLRREITLFMAAFVAFYCVVYSQSCVEARFGLPLITVFSCYMASGFRFFKDNGISLKARGVVLACLLLYNAAVLFISNSIHHVVQFLD
jgi:hypothetical protein